MQAGTAGLTEGAALWRRHEVERRTGLSKSRIYELARRGAFPAPVKLSARSVAWVAAEVEAWIIGRVAASRAGV